MIILFLLRESIDEKIPFQFEIFLSNLHIMCMLIALKYKLFLESALGPIFNTRTIIVLRKLFVILNTCIHGQCLLVMLRCILSNKESISYQKSQAIP